tara:strand:+ start:4961 stop:5218 length:258 start_codon:yes stop_codon:yes gene_type:complete
MRSKTDVQGKPLNHGVSWGEVGNVVIKGLSRGPGEPVVLDNPRRAQPRRVLSSDGVSSDLKNEGGELSVISDLEAGESFNLIVEY